MLGLPACAALTTTLGTPGPHPTVRPLPVRGTDLFDWKGIVHNHGRLSHDSEGTIDEMAAACESADIDFVVMTDHQTDASIAEGQRGMVGRTLFLVGAEVRSPQGTLLCFPLTRPLRRFQHVALLAKEAAAQGALSFVCHAELWKASWNVPGLAGAEIVNLHAGALTVDKIGTLGTALFLPMRSLCERICYRDPDVFSQWDAQLARQHPFTPVGGNDAHANVRLFGPLGGTIGNYQEVFQTLSTHVLAEHLDEASLVEAFAAGRTYVSFDVFGEGAGFDFRAVDGEGGVHLGGATVQHGDGVTLRVLTPVSGHIQLFRDGREMHARDAVTLVVHAPPPGIYRVEVQTARGDPWLFSSSIRVQ
ncbi:MAG TPA: hypothetical protein VFZ65_12495 [Planctomycetota bacterium]|nr:hypothetical protein [Planctomycetota bacterium]